MSYSQMSGESAAPVRAAAPDDAASAGARLRDARMAAGLSIDDVAHQLKLAPRQVKALEDSDFAQLPGRTFVRGFMRNYARLLRLDPGAVLAALPEAGTAPSLDHPSLAATTRVMGELPAEAHDKPSSARWAIPLALVTIVAIAVIYEFGRPLAEQGKAALADRISAATSASDTAAAGGAAGTDSAAARSDTTASPSSATGDTPLAFVFRGTSSIEVKDAKGALVLSTIGYPGAKHAVGGTAPFEVVLGNAEAVTVTWRGVPFDATPFIKQNVAKFTIK